MVEAVATSNNAQDVHFVVSEIPVLCTCMSVTLRQVLDLDVLRRAGARVVAGADQLDRPVRWVHIAEIADIASLINGGELLLTTGMGIDRTAAAQRKYLASIADAGAAGLVVELGRMFTEVPQVMVQVANLRGFPLIALEHPTRYIDVTEAVHRAIISHQYTLLRQAEGISRDFTDLILGGAGIGQIIARLAEILGNPVVLEDAAHNVIELAGAVPWEQHAQVQHTETERGRVQHGSACMWFGIWLRHEAWGRVHVLETDRALDEITGLVLDRAGAALGLALLSQKDAAHLAGRAGSALLADVLAGRHGSLTEFLRRARSLGVDLTGGKLAALVVEPTSLAELARRSALGEEERQRIRMRLAEEIRRAARDRGCAALVGLDADRVLAVVAVPGAAPGAMPGAMPGAVPGGAVQAGLDDIVTATRRRLPGSLTVVAGASREMAGASREVAGASREVAASSLQRALEEAIEALEFGRKSADQSRPVHYFGDLGIYQLLVRLAQDPELSRFVDSELGPLLSYDASSRAKLLPTLRSYLDNAGRKADTVRALSVQRRTLYARLARIEQILRRDLSAADTRVRLALALQGLDLLRDRQRRQKVKDQPISSERPGFLRRDE
jgi:PucR family transcriptional regulator, purine catabolism regulatory protein